jgi:carboxymethylenebutenolidase
VSYVAAKWADELGVDASVSFYGQVDKELGELRCPTILLFGGQDEYISRDRVAAVEAFHPGLVHVYEGNGHAFMRDKDEASYDADTAADAWGRMLAHFGAHLAASETGVI